MIVRALLKEFTPCPCPGLRRVLARVDELWRWLQGSSIWAICVGLSYDFLCTNPGISVQNKRFSLILQRSYVKVSYASELLGFMKFKMINIVE